MPVTKMLVILALIFFTVSCAAQPAVHTKSELYGRYTKEDKIYGNKPVNQYRSIGKVEDVPCKGRITDLLASHHLNAELDQNDIELTDCIRFGDSAIAFVGLNTNVTMSSQDMETPRPFYHGFIYIDFKRDIVGVTTLDVIDVDLEVGGYTRSLWDMVEIGNRQYLLVLLREYESYSFELYEIQKLGIEKIDEHYIGGL